MPAAPTPRLVSAPQDRWGLGALGAVGSTLTALAGRHLVRLLLGAAALWLLLWTVLLLSLLGVALRWIAAPG